MTRRAGSTIIVALLLSRLAHGQVPETLSLGGDRSSARSEPDMIASLPRARSESPNSRLQASGRIRKSASKRARNPTLGVRRYAAARGPRKATATDGRRKAGIAVSEAETAKTTADVLSDVRRAYYQVVARIRRVDVAQELEVLAGRARDAAQERFQTGAAPRLEALQSQLVLAQAQNDSTTARGELTARGQS